MNSVCRITTYGLINRLFKALFAQNLLKTYGKYRKNYAMNLCALLCIGIWRRARSFGSDTQIKRSSNFVFRLVPTPHHNRTLEFLSSAHLFEDSTSLFVHLSQHGLFCFSDLSKTVNYFNALNR